MGTSSLIIPELISSSGRTCHLALPDVKRITDVRKYMAETQEFNGSVEKLTDFIGRQEQQCQDVIKLLKEQVTIKMNALHQVKEDMLDLQRYLQMPDANERYKMGTKILVKFSDETEINEYHVPDALQRYSIKMSTLYGEILGLDSDVDYVEYLRSVAKVNKDFVQDWYKREKLNKVRLPNRNKATADSK